MADLTPEDFERIGLPWPKADAAIGMRPGLRFSRCIDLNWQTEREIVHYIACAPVYPSREVPTRFELTYYDDGDEREVPVEWRTLSDEEFADAVAKYEKAVKTFHAEGGTFRTATTVGQTVVSGTFILEDGSIAEARGDGVHGWIVTEWRSG